MKKLFKTTWQHIRRSPYQSLTAVSIMTLTLFVALTFFLTAFSLSSILSYFEKKPQVTVFFTAEKKAEDIKALELKLKEDSRISQTKYVSKEEALSIYQEQNKKDPLLLEMVTANILPASLDVSAKDPKDLPGIVKILEAETEVEEVVFQKDVVDLLVSWTQNLRKAGFVLIGLLLMVSLFVIIMVIGIKISYRKEEIGILQLLGSSKNYIRLPFLLEGIFYGAISGFVSWAIAMILLLILMPSLSSFLNGIPYLPISPLFVLAVFLGIFLTGIGLGGLGSLLAVWRYLRP